MTADRPVARRQPRPAADEGTDPVFSQQSSPTPPPPAVVEPATTAGERRQAATPGDSSGPAQPASATRSAGTKAQEKSRKPAKASPPKQDSPSPIRRGPEPTVQLNSRIAVSVSDLLEQEHARTGRSKRELLEHALRNTYE